MLQIPTGEDGATPAPVGSAARRWISASFRLSASGLAIGIVSISVVPLLSVTPLALLFILTIPLAVLGAAAGLVGLALGGGRSAAVAVIAGLMLAAGAPASIRLLAWVT